MEEQAFQGDLTTMRVLQYILMHLNVSQYPQPSKVLSQYSVNHT